MPLVNVTVNARAYTIACDDGEEDHLRALAAMVDAKAREVLSSVGQVGDTRLLLMAALLLADEHQSASQRLDTTSQQAGDMAGIHEQLSARLVSSENLAVAAMDAAAQRIESLAATLR